MQHKPATPVTDVAGSAASGPAGEGALTAREIRAVDAIVATEQPVIPADAATARADQSQPLLPIALTRHQQLELSTISPRPRKLRVGLGWTGPNADEVTFWDKLAGRKPIDLDASCILLNEMNQVVETVWFRNLRTRDDSVRHMGDSLDGNDRGMQSGNRIDDEVIDIDLMDVDKVVKTIVIGASSFSGQTFNHVAHATCRLYDMDEEMLLAEMDLTERGSHTGILFAMLKRFDQHWMLTAMNAKFNDCHTIEDMGKYVSTLLTYDIR